MQKIINTENLKAVRERERELYFNEEKCGIILNSEKSLEKNVINNINETRLNLYKNI